jgi:predicted dinucleotide-utilizing enzyme
VRLELRHEPAAVHQLVLSARGAFGDFEATLRPTPRDDRLSHIVALSLLATLRRRRQSVTIL